MGILIPVNHLSIAPALRHSLPSPFSLEREKGRRKREGNRPKPNCPNRFRTLQTKRAGYAKIRPRRKGWLWGRTDRNYFRSLDKTNQRTTPYPQNCIDRRLGSPSSTNLSNSLLGEPPRQPEVRRSRFRLHL
ncbi:hypothetical protein HOY80DRAFT_1009386 [Tuber brumale]|nr:hypothetical protein HOY80DRAFT_1009386 [Tuber brumale]